MFFFFQQEFRAIEVKMIDITCFCCDSVSFLLLFIFYSGFLGWASIADIRFFTRMSLCIQNTEASAAAKTAHVHVLPANRIKWNKIKWNGWKITDILFIRKRWLDYSWLFIIDKKGTVFARNGLFETVWICHGAKDLLIYFIPLFNVIYFSSLVSDSIQPIVLNIRFLVFPDANCGTSLAQSWAERWWFEEVCALFDDCTFLQHSLSIPFNYSYSEQWPFKLQFNAFVFFYA